MTRSTFKFQSYELEIVLKQSLMMILFESNVSFLLIIFQTFLAKAFQSFLAEGKQKSGKGEPVNLKIETGVQSHWGEFDLFSSSDDVSESTMLQFAIKLQKLSLSSFKVP